MNNDKLREAAERLVTKLQLIHVDPAYQAVWTLVFTHGGYDGPNYGLELEELVKALAEPASGSARSMTDEEKKATDGFYLSHFKPEPVDDKALAEAIKYTQYLSAQGGCEPAPWGPHKQLQLETVLAALRAAQQEVAELRETLSAIKAVNVDEHGQVGDAAINRLIDSVFKARAAGEGKGAT